MHHYPTREERIREGRRWRRKRAVKVFAPWILAIIAVVSLAICFRFAKNEKERPVSETFYEPTIIEVDEELEWTGTLVNAVIVGDEAAGVEAAKHEGVDYEEIRLLSQIMAAESGPNWPDCYIMMIGEVVLNRVESPEWPNTISAVLHQYGQYEPVADGSIENIVPRENVVRLALRLLQGERAWYDESIMWQSLEPQGEQVATMWYDSDLGTTTYFCR